MKGSLTQPESAGRATLAKPLAPEDIQRGDYVSVLRETYEVPSFVWDCCSAFDDRTKLVPLHVLPDSPAEPLKVKAVCLPFVWVRRSSGHECGLDVRRFQLARLDDHYARTSWKATKRKSGRGRSKAKRKRKK